LPARRRFGTAALASLAALVSGCSAGRILNALTPSGTYARTEALAYGDHPRLALDVYVPSGSRASSPVVVFFYGGNWNSGARGEYVFAGEALASRGFVAVLPDYRLYPEVKFPDFLDDCARAVQWTVRNASRFGGDSARIHLMGHSAGAYNAAMLALRRSYLEARAVDPRAIRGFIGLAGPYDFLPPKGPVTRAVFGFPDTPRATQPIEHVRADAPPALLMTGADDTTVDPGNSDRLGARLRAAGASARVVRYPGVGHTRLVGALAAPLRGSAPVLDDIEAFVRS